MRLLNFCRYIPITVLSTMFLAATANAQVSGGGGAPLVCSANTSSLPTLRSEGLTEVVGDIVIACTGGLPLPPGQMSPPVKHHYLADLAGNEPPAQREHF